MKYLVVFVLVGLLAFDISASSLHKHSDESDSHKSEESHEKRPSHRSYDRSDESSDSSDEAVSKPAKSLAIGLNPGGEGKKSEGVDKLIRVVKHLVGKVNAEPLFRSKKFDFGESSGVGENKRSKSSVGIELDTPTLLNFVTKVISSHKFKKATDEVARKAAVIFRALEESN